MRDRARRNGVIQSSWVMKGGSGGGVLTKDMAHDTKHNRRDTQDDGY